MISKDYMALAFLALANPLTDLTSMEIWGKIGAMTLKEEVLTLLSSEAPLPFMAIILFLSMNKADKKEELN